MGLHLKTCIKLYHACKFEYETNPYPFPCIHYPIPNHICNLKIISHQFPIINKPIPIIPYPSCRTQGQGAILSPFLFCFYMNDLFRLLRDSRTGCHIGNHFAGAIGYADDLLLLCPSRKGVQEMLSIAEKYAADHKIAFSTHHLPDYAKTMLFSRYMSWGTSQVSSSVSTPASQG